MTIFDSVRQLLEQGDTGQALRLLITYLEKEKSSPGALRILRVVEANYKADRNKELKGILDFSEARRAYSKTNDALFTVLEDLAAGREPSFEPENDRPQTSRIFWLIGGGILLMLMLITGILLYKSNQTAGSVQPPDCPPFDKKGVPILIIPFQNLGDGKLSPELAIQTRIRDLTQRNSMPSDVQIFAGTQFDKSTPDKDDAAQQGRACGAQMVIWGQYEKINEGISLDVRYVFTEKASIPAGPQAEIFRNLSELRADKTKFNDLENAVFSLCTRLALHEGRLDLAEKWVSKMTEFNPTDQRIKDLLKNSR